MNKLLSLGAASLLLGMIAILGLALSGGWALGANNTVRERLVGAWHLTRLEEPGAGGRIRRADCTGLLVFTGDGHMSVQVMYRNPGAAPVQYARDGYESSFGTYVIDERAHIFTFHVDGALVRTLIGKDLPRVYEFSGKQLIVKSSNPTEHWNVAWQHY